MATLEIEAETTAKPRRRKRSTTTKPKRVKAQKAEKAPRLRAPLPTNLEDMRLAPGGVHTSEKNRYINISFASGAEVRLYPVGVPPKEVKKVSDLMVAWLTKRLGA